jgi:acylphosphatase
MQCDCELSGEAMQQGTEPAALHAIVHGRVQGVGFRDWTRRRARALGCTGWVRNLADGRSVEVLAEGSSTAIETLLQLLQSGPPGGFVSRVDVDRPLVAANLSDFTILR